MAKSMLELYYDIEAKKKAGEETVSIDLMFEIMDAVTEFEIEVNKRLQNIEEKLSDN